MLVLGIKLLVVGCLVNNLISKLNILVNLFN